MDKTVLKVKAVNGLNLRKAPEGEIVAVLKHGTQVTLMGENGVWVQVKCGKKTGYVMSEFLEEEN